MDWSPVGLSSDPVPGDAVMVLTGGNDYLEVADSIDRAARRMGQLETGGMVSEALDALMERKEETIEDISKAHARYAATGQALVDYAEVLRVAQDDSAAALERARSAAADAEDAAGRQRYYVDLADGAQDAAERTQWERLADQFSGDADSANGAVAAARADVESAVEARDRAAERAIGNIEDITEHDGLKDGWWDNWGADLVAAITDIAGWVSTIAGVLAIAVAWIPVVGQALAGVLLIVSAVAAIVNALGNIALAATGERSWTEAIISIAGAALSCIGLGGAAKAIGRLVTRRVLLSEGRNGLTAAGRAAGSGRFLVDQAEAAVTAFRARDAWRLLTNDPRALWESARAWTRSVPALRDGDRVFRVWGDDAARGANAARKGGSWSPVHPHTLHNPRSTLGLPSKPFSEEGFNPMSNLVVGEVVDSSARQATRHALPYHGNPGGAPEHLFRGWEESGAIRAVEDVVLVAR